MSNLLVFVIAVASLIAAIAGFFVNARGHLGTNLTQLAVENQKRRGQILAADARLKVSGIVAAAVMPVLFVTGCATTPQAATSPQAPTPTETSAAGPSPVDGAAVTIGVIRDRVAATTLCNTWLGDPAAALPILTGHDGTNFEWKGEPYTNETRPEGVTCGLGQFGKPGPEVEIFAVNSPDYGGQADFTVGKLDVGSSFLNVTAADLEPAAFKDWVAAAASRVTDSSGAKFETPAGDLTYQDVTIPKSVEANTSGAAACTRLLGDVDQFAHRILNQDAETRWFWGGGFDEPDSDSVIGCQINKFIYDPAAHPDENRLLSITVDKKVNRFSDDQLPFGPYFLSYKFGDADPTVTDQLDPATFTSWLEGAAEHLHN